MIRDYKKEYHLFQVWQLFSLFFAEKEKAMKICKKFPEWNKHSPREWKLEYDFLFRGTDAHRNIPLWASVSKKEKVLLNQTTLEVIQFYHKLGYEPVGMEGNPYDYIGEQICFLAYLTAAICYESQNGGAVDQLLDAREDFIQYYTLDTAKMIKDAVNKHTVFEGYNRFLKYLLQILVDFDEAEKIQKEWLEIDIYDMTDIIEHGKKEAIKDEEAHVINTAGINNCGGKCVIRPTVQEGCMLNISSDCSSNWPQIRACVRGRGYRKTFLNSGRLRYPMKRIGKRGSGKFERISWKEAVTIIADNWKRIKENYGPGARYLNYGTGVTGIMRPGTLARRLMALDGGYLDYFNSYSSACANYTSPYIYGTTSVGSSPADLLNTKLLIMWGDNPAETIIGPERNYYLSQLKDKGIRIIVVDPRKSQTAVAYADEWIAIRPSADSALADAMAYVIWSENLQDQHFMDTYCLGFDEMHMPEGIPEGESYHSYLFGKKDGIPKAPEWAEKITGIEAETIRRLAREYGTTKPACIMAGLGVQRHGNGEQGTRSICMLTCLTGNVGIPGGGAGRNAEIAEHQEPSLFNNKVMNPYPGKIPVFLWTKAIEHGIEMTPREDRIKGMDRLDSNIKMIFNLAGNTLINQHSDINDTIRILEDHRKCEFIICSDIFMTPSAKYSDIILPATSVFEGNNIVNPWIGGNYILKNNQVIKPLFDCRFEWEWLKDVAKGLGLYEEFIDGKPNLEQWLEENYNVLREKETGLPDYQTFSKLGGWQYKDPICSVAFEQEIADPEHHPFATPSGKIEIFSKRLYDFHQWDDIPAIPKYVPCPEGPEDDLKEKYPLQLIGWHTRRRCHSIHDNNEWQDEIEMPGLWIHPEDAKERNIKQGELVKIWNDRGAVKIPAIVTKRIRKGVVAMSQGGWYTPNEAGEDVRGSINVLTSAEHRTPLAKGNPQHTNLVEVSTA